MLPSTGYFKTIPCPFFEMGFCERPFCHLRHRKTEDNEPPGPSQNVSSNLKKEYVEEEVKEYQEIKPDPDAKPPIVSEAKEGKPEVPLESSSSNLQHLVEEAVKKVLLGGGLDPSKLLAGGGLDSSKLLGSVDPSILSKIKEEKQDSDDDG